MARDLTPLVSVAIPCYEMHGRGAEFLDFGLSQIWSQRYPAIEVVVADHSEDDAVARVCEAWTDRLTLRYVRNPSKRGSSSANLNVAIENASGELIKVLCQDDYLSDEGAIERTVAAIGTASWLVSSYLHTNDRERLFDRQDPRLTADLAFVNTVGTHSCLTIRNVHQPERFDEDLIWVMDSEYYRRLYDRFGPPAVLHEVTVIQTLWKGQVTNTYASDPKLRNAEIETVKHRYRKSLPNLPPSVPRSGVLRGLKRTLR